MQDQAIHAGQGDAVNAIDPQLVGAFGRASGAAALADALVAVTRPDAAVGPATSIETHTVVPLVETVFYGGFGMGLGDGGSRRRADGEQSGSESGSGGGGGGGGGGQSRTVAVVVLGPDGVEVRPVVDVTKLGLAGIGVALTLFGMLRHRRRR